MKSQKKRIGKRASRRNRRASRVTMSFESLENRTLMAADLAGIDLVADSPDGASAEVCEPRSESAYVDQRALRSVQDNPVGIDPLPTPHPRVADAVLRAGFVPDPSPVARSADLDSLAAVGSHRHGVNANDYDMGMGWSARDSNDLVGIAPLPTPHPRPEAAVEYVGLVPIPSGRPRPETELELAGWIPEPTIQPGPEAAIERVGLVPIPSGRPRAEMEAASVKIEPNPTPAPRSEATSNDDSPVGIAPLPSPHPRPEAKVGQVGIEPNPTPRPTETGFAARAMSWFSRAF